MDGRERAEGDIGIVRRACAPLKRLEEASMPIDEERSAFHRAHLAWADGNFEHFMSLLDDDIVYAVNVDGHQVPYASSAVGKDEVAGRLRLLLDTFLVQAFVVESLVHEDECSRSMVLGYYKHKKTGERLDIKVRFVGWVRDGLIVRLEEYHDAAYIHAFERFVAHLQAAAADLAAVPSTS
jgi:ketosteroid isomerase-like protein